MWFSLLLLSLLAFFPPADTAPPDAYNQILKAEAAWDAANLHRDPEALKRILAPEFIQINENGTVTSRDEELVQLAGYPNRAAGCKVDKRVIKIRGDTAVLTAVYTEVGQSPKGFYRVVFNIADVYRYTAGEWKGLVGYGHIVEVKSGQPKPLSL